MVLEDPTPSLADSSGMCHLDCIYFTLDLCIVLLGLPKVNVDKEFTVLSETRHAEPGQLERIEADIQTYTNYLQSHELSVDFLPYTAKHHCSS
jgi:hypothetical protein